MLSHIFEEVIPDPEKTSEKTVKKWEIVVGGLYFVGMYFVGKLLL